MPENIKSLKLPGKEFCLIHGNSGSGPKTEYCIHGNIAYNEEDNLKSSQTLAKPKLTPPEIDTNKIISFEHSSLNSLYANVITDGNPDDNIYQNVNIHANQSFSTKSAFRKASLTVPGSKSLDDLHLYSSSHENNSQVSKNKIDTICLLSHIDRSVMPSNFKFTGLFAVNDVTDNVGLDLSFWSKFYADALSSARLRYVKDLASNTSSISLPDITNEYPATFNEKLDTLSIVNCRKKLDRDSQIFDMSDILNNLCLRKDVKKKYFRSIKEINQNPEILFEVCWEKGKHTGKRSSTEFVKIGRGSFKKRTKSNNKITFGQFLTLMSPVKFKRKDKSSRTSYKSHSIFDDRLTEFRKSKLGSKIDHHMRELKTKFRRNFIANSDTWPSSIQLSPLNSRTPRIMDHDLNSKNSVKKSCSIRELQKDIRADENYTLSDDVNHYENVDFIIKHTDEPLENIYRSPLYSTQTLNTINPIEDNGSSETQHLSQLSTSIKFLHQFHTTMVAKPNKTNPNAEQILRRSKTMIEPCSKNVGRRLARWSTVSLDAMHRVEVSREFEQVKGGRN